MIVNRELAAIQNYQEEENVKFKPCFTTPAQVFAIYTIDEVSMEIILTIPPQFPLRHVTVDGGRRAGVSEGKWRHWLLSTSAAIHQVIKF